MKTIDISAITILPNRQRRDFNPNKMQEFSDGIRKRGLLHPIILREHEGKFILVAGERRLRAVTDIADLGDSIRHDGQLVPLNSIPYTLLHELDPIAYEEAELEENTHRVDLSWQERAVAVSRLAALRTKQAAARGESPPSVAAISLEVRGSSEGIHHESTRQELIVARHLDKPEVQAAKTVKDAFKILKKAEAAERNRELGALVGKTFTADLHQAINGNSLEWMAKAETGQFDVILTDPPYGMGADEFGDSGGMAGGTHSYDDSPEAFLAIMQDFPRESFRLAKEQAHLYLFCDVGWFGWLREKFAEAGWQVFRTPLIWYKRHGMRAPWPELGPQRKYETILYAIKGKRPILKMVGDVLDYPADAQLGHAAQKPVALYEDLLRRSCQPGDTVFDPFMGSGPIFGAAHLLKVRATGIELDQANYGIALGRLKGLKAQQELDLAIGL